MPTIFYNRLQKKYGDQLLKGKKYKAMLDEIIANNNEKIARATLRISKENYNKSLKKISVEKRKFVKLPDISDVLPKRSVFTIKSAEQGKIISTTLKDKINKDLRQTLEEFKTLERQRGRGVSKMNPELVNVFQKKLKETFEEYTKKDKITGVPPQIRNIAVTEMRSTVDEIKEAYNKNLLKKNPGMKMIKEWIHNKSLSRKFRETHAARNTKKEVVNEFFQVPREDGGFDLMQRPHDPNAPLEQIIGCSCEVRYLATV